MKIVSRWGRPMQSEKLGFPNPAPVARARVARAGPSAGARSTCLTGTFAVRLNDRSLAPEPNPSRPEKT